MGEGTLLRPLRRIQASLLQPHPLADAATLRRKLAKASLRGEGQDEGRFARSLRRPLHNPAPKPSSLAMTAGFAAP